MAASALRCLPDDVGSYAPGSGGGHRRRTLAASNLGPTQEVDANAYAAAMKTSHLSPTALRKSRKPVRTAGNLLGLCSPVEGPRLPKGCSQALSKGLLLPPALDIR